MTGSTSATSSTAVGAVELREVATRLGSKNGREGKMAKLTVSATKPLGWPEMDRSDDGVEGDLRRRRFGRGRCGGLGRCERSGLGLLDEVDSGGAPGHDERTHGRRGARLRRRHGGGSVGHGWGARGGGAGEESGCLGGSGKRGGAIHDVTGRGERRGGEQVRGARRGRRRAPACLPGRQAARWSSAGLGRQVGRVLAPGKFFHFSLFSVF